MHRTPSIIERAGRSSGKHRSTTYEVAGHNLCTSLGLADVDIPSARLLDRRSWVMPCGHASKDRRDCELSMQIGIERARMLNCLVKQVSGGFKLHCSL